MSQSFQQTEARRIAYDQTEGRGPGVVFLGGFKSDKEGTKARYLEQWAQRRGRAFLRFDYSGHGQSSGNFLDGSLTDWAEDAAAIIGNLTSGRQILVGSSMGAWIALLIAREMTDRVAGLVTIAGAPDFTEDKLWDGLSAGQRSQLLKSGQIALPSDYSEEPYVITRHLIEDGRKRLVLRSSIPLPFPVRILHGTVDMDVDMSVSLRLLEQAQGDDIQLTLVKGADHRFSNPECLALIVNAIEDVTARSV
ncbi:MAG: alpha/beta hydrolase [Silicimonas sp.]|nr:alpha/beta hydrolase [Silicimonas sp.]